MITKMEEIVTEAKNEFIDKVKRTIFHKQYHIPTPKGVQTVNVKDSSVKSALSTILPKNTIKLIGDHIEHYFLLRSFISFTSSPQSFRTAWGLRSQNLTPWDADILTNEGAQLLPINDESKMFQTIQQGVEYGPAKRLILGVRHSEGNFDDKLDDLGRFTYQPPANVTGVLRYRWCQHLSEKMELPYILLAVMWFKTHNPINKKLNHAFIITPAKIIDPEKDTGDIKSNLAKPLTLQLITRSEALSTLNLIFSMNETDSVIETRSPLQDALGREWSYGHINNAQKGRQIKHWAKNTGKRCPGTHCKNGHQHVEFEDLNQSEIAFGHIIPQNWAKAFTYLLDRVDHPDNLYLTCKHCNSSLGDKFPDMALRESIVNNGTIGDWLRLNEDQIRKS